MDPLNPQALAQQNTFWQAIKDRLTPSPMGLLGSGMVQNAAQQQLSRPYMLYAQEAIAMGQQPMPPEQWQQMQQQGQQAKSLL